MMPGMSMLSSEMLTQKWGVTERLSLNTTQATPMLGMAA